MTFAISALAQTTNKQAAFLGCEADGMLRQPLSLGEASTLGQQLAAHPYGESAREKLLKYYWRNGLRELRLGGSDHACRGDFLISEQPVK